MRTETRSLVRREDPREIYQFSSTRKVAVFGPDKIHAVTAIVETQHGWSVLLDAPLGDVRRQVVTADESWPDTWTWIPCED